MNESKEWRVIEEAPKYEVSNYGDVRNRNTGRCLAGSVDKDGYKRVSIRTDDGRVITRYRHRLAAMAFLPNPENLPIINHKDETRTNNYVGCKEHNYEDGNLEWCDQKYNVHYGTCLERAVESRKKYYKKHGGHSSKSAKTVYVYSKDKSTFIRECGSITQAAKVMDTDYRSVWKVLNGMRPSAGGYFFSFVKLN